MILNIDNNQLINKLKENNNPEKFQIKYIYNFIWIKKPFNPISIMKEITNEYQLKKDQFLNYNTTISLSDIKAKELQLFINKRSLMQFHDYPKLTANEITKTIKNK